MKKLTVILLAIATFCCVYGNDKPQYNSICIYNALEDEPQVYLCSQVKGIAINAEGNSYLQDIQLDTHNIVSEISASDSIMFFNPYVDGVAEIEGNIGVWDKAYVTPIGYFCYKSELPYASEDIEKDSYEMLSYVSFDMQEKVCVSYSNRSHLPLWLVNDSVSMYWGYFQDNVTYSLTVGDRMLSGEKVLTYDFPLLNSKIEDTGNELVRCLLSLVSLLDGRIEEQVSLQSLISDDFKPIIENITESNEPYIPKDKGGEYVFVPKHDELLEVGDVYYSVVAITCGASGILPYSASLGGTVQCSSSQFRTDGEYGILCDADIDNLTLDKAKFVLNGSQEKLALGYTVDIEELLPGTEYYYRAYYKINSDDSELKIKFETDAHDQTETYGKIMKFKTLDLPQVVTGELLEVSDNSAVVECLFSKLPEESVCGLEYSWDGGSEKIVAECESGETSIKIDGLKAATTYRYRAYVEAYGQIYYGEEMSFTTDLPDISGEWQCIEEYSYRPFPGAEWETRTREYTLTFGGDGSMVSSQYEYVDGTGGYSLSTDGKFRASGFLIATQNQTTIERYEGRVDDITNPTKITGSRYISNTNQVTSVENFEGSFTLTRK